MDLGILRALKTVKSNPYVQYVGIGLAGLVTQKELHDERTGTPLRKSKMQLIRISAAVCGIELCYAAETAFVSPILLKLGVPASLMSMVWCLSPILGFFLVPIMGSLSDRCSLRLGRRRPFIILMSIGIILGLCLVPNGELLGIWVGDSGNETINAYPGRNSSLVFSFTLPPEHIRGIIFTIFGVAMLDFNCDACQSPCRAYLLDVCVPEDHSTGLTMFTVMAGLGGTVGYVMGGIDWNATSFGEALGGHIRVVFSIVLVAFFVFVISTLTSFREIPLAELNVTNAEMQTSKKKVVLSEGNRGASAPPGSSTRGDEINPYAKNSHSTTNGDVRPPADVIDTVEVSADVTLRTYLRSIVRMPRSMWVLCLCNLLCWMSLVCYSLYFTDFVGQSVYGGDPKAPVGSELHDKYDEGVRLGSFGMSLYSFSCACYSLGIEKLVQRFRAKRVYVLGQLVFTLGMAGMAASRSKVAVILLSPAAGIMYATLFTMPYLLVAHYHTRGLFSHGDELHGDRKQVRGLGTDVAIISSMVFLAQFVLSVIMGTVVTAVDSTTAVIVASSILSFLGSVTATQITYLDL
ncbi:unnamed protein product [Lymnaea stagnalis]|uniref:Proton-associated sugar transporter A n=1 Tax=Lymnaea stagnalis TaxID=6523 RepID=A0AAV2HW13_LYMST